MLSWVSIERYSEEVGKHFGGVGFLDMGEGLVEGGGVEQLFFGQHEYVLGFSGESEIDGFGSEGSVGEGSEDLSHC